MFYRCQKVQHKPIKSLSWSSKRKEQNQPKAALVWCTGLSGVPPDNVRCTREINSELLSFGFLKSHSAIIHRTVRCSTRLSGVAPDCPVCHAEQRLLRQRSSTKVNSEHEQCADSARRVRAAPEGAPDSEQ
jgi:hypothetical protein